MRTSVYTHRLGNRTLEDWSAENDIEYANATPGAVIHDQTARTLADWYKTVNPNDHALLALAQGTEFDTDELFDSIERAGFYPDHYIAMTDWFNALCERLRTEY